jgi:hypothetical protein
MNIIVNRFTDDLIENLDTRNIPKKIDLVISGGAFNGCYAIGILMYIKKLEKIKKIKVNRISGASVGSIAGIAYLLDKLDIFNDISNEIIRLYKTRYNLYHVREKLMNVLKLMDKDDYKKLNKKLYITYFDVIKKKQIVIKTYKNNRNVIESIFKSCYIPFIMDGNISYNGKIDGGYPYIFKNRKKKIMYINLLSFDIVKQAFCLKNEKNGYLRILNGILNANTFFNLNKRTQICSYINDSDISDFLLFTSKKYFVLIILIILDIISKIKNIIPYDIVKTKYYICFKHITFNLYKDVMDKLIN